MSRAASATLRMRSREETERLGERIGAAARPGDVVALSGELGTGKTTLVRGIARGLGIDERRVTSPTFVIVQEHEGGRIPLVHVDLYRLTPAEVSSTGWEEALAGGVVAIEWPDRLGPALPADRLDVSIAHAGGDERDVRIDATGERSALLRAAATA